MTSLTLSMTFANQVRIATGAAARGLDAAVDHNAPLSAGAMKGLMRDEARWLLPGVGGQDHPFVVAVFGGPRGEQSPWNFDVQPLGDVTYSTRANLRLDERGAVVPGGLRVLEEASIGAASLRVDSRSPLHGRGLPHTLLDRERDHHLALLHLSARAVEKVGQDRSRGMGWVSISCDRPVAADLDLIWMLRGQELAS